MCSYFSKGVADNVGVWDFDEFFLPRGQFNNIPDMLNSVGFKKGIQENFHPDPRTKNFSEIQKNWKKGRGLADGNGHPYCYLLLDSEVTLVDVIMMDAPETVSTELKKKIAALSILSFYTLFSFYFLFQFTPL